MLSQSYEPVETMDEEQETRWKVLPVLLRLIHRAAMSSQAELSILCSVEIVKALLEAHANGQDVNLNALKAQVAKKRKSTVIPRLVDIIAAVPQEARDILLPKLRAKPVRTASGVSPSRTVGGGGAHPVLHRLPSLQSCPSPTVVPISP
jgi:hypothetical protein